MAQQAPLSMGFSRQEYWSGLPCPSPGHLPHPGILLCKSNCAESLHPSALLYSSGQPLEKVAIPILLMRKTEASKRQGVCLRSLRVTQGSTGLKAPSSLSHTNAVIIPLSGLMVEGTNSGNQAIQNTSHSPCVTLGKLLSVSGPQLPHL